MESVTTNFLMKEQELFKYYKYDLSEREIWLKGKALIFLFIALLFIILIIIAPISQLLGTNKTIMSSIMIVGIIFSFIFSRLSNYYAIDYAFTQYPQYSPLLKKSLIRRTNKNTFLRAYRADKLMQKLQEPDLENLSIEELIVYYSNTSETISSKRWWPVTLTAVIAFPVWSEFVGVMIGSGTSLEEKVAVSLVFLLVSFSITFLISTVRNTLEITLLSLPGELNDFVDILKLIRLSRV